VRLRPLLRALGYALATCDSAGRVLDADESWAGVVGPVADEVAAIRPGPRPLPGARGAKGSRQVDALAASDLAPGDALETVATTIVPSGVDGDARFVELVAVPLGAAGGSFVLGAREVPSRAAAGGARANRAASPESTDVPEHTVAGRLAALYAAVAEASPIGLALWRHEPRDGSLTLVATNAAARDLTNLAEESVGRTSAELSERCPTIGELRWGAASESRGPPAALGTLELAGADGRRRAVELVMSPIGDGVLVLRLTDVTAEAHARRDRQQLLRRVADAEDAERRRIAEALHDDTIQILAAVNMDLGGLRRRSSDRALAERIERVEHRVRQATHALRSLVFELYPPDLVSGGLVAALPALAERVFEHTGTKTTIVNELRHAAGTEVRVAAYRIVQEALVNVRRHAQASRVKITLARDGEMFVATVADDGIGPGAPGAAGAPGHFGLRTMRERAESMQGSLTVRRAEPSGMEIEVRLPDPELADADDP